MGVNEIAAKGFTYCKKTESKGVHHVSLVAVKAALHIMTAATITFVMFISVYHVSLQTDTVM